MEHVYFPPPEEPATDNSISNQSLFLRRLSSRWGEVLSYSVHAYNYHIDIFRMTGSEDFGLQKRHLAMLVELRRKALLGVSRAAYKLFENNDVREALKQANSLLVPGLGALAGNPCDGDTEVVEAVREEWCQYLTHPGLSEGTLMLLSTDDIFCSGYMYNHIVMHKKHGMLWSITALTNTTKALDGH